MKPLLCAIPLALTACGETPEINGFKDISFGATRSRLEAAGFSCDVGECQLRADQTSTVEPLDMASANAERGQQRFARCSACHTISRNGSDGVGPNLWAVIGRRVADGDRFAYSDALKGVGGSWNFAKLDRFLASPRSVAPGTKMTFTGMANGSDRTDLLAYLNQQSPTPQPLPKAVPGAAKQRPQATRSYTIFGKEAIVRPHLDNGLVSTIDVTVFISEEQVIGLLTDQYGKAQSFVYQTFIGGQAKTTFWTSAAGTSVSTTEIISNGPLGITGLDPSLRRLGVEPSDSTQTHTTITYLDKRRTADLIQRSRSLKVDANDL